jgi:hypothetical protein
MSYATSPPFGNIGKTTVTLSTAGHSYEDAATIAGCAVGTIKSRVNRARRRLVEILSVPRGVGRQPAARLNGDRGRVLACPAGWEKIRVDPRRLKPSNAWFGTEVERVRDEMTGGEQVSRPGH